VCAVLFGDIGFKAAGSLGRNIVYVVIYSLDATQCVIIHLAATQALRHTFPEDDTPALWQCGAAVWVVACLFAQVWLEKRECLRVLITFSSKNIF
jgi:vesicular inhibitory amino acid transporter